MTFSAASATHDRWPLRRNVAGIHLEELPRMADFSLWATACETAFWPAGTFTQVYQANRRAAIEDLIDADPVAARIREMIHHAEFRRRPDDRKAMTETVERAN
jgi:hypothetical protein